MTSNFFFLSQTLAKFQPFGLDINRINDRNNVCTVAFITAQLLNAKYAVVKIVIHLSLTFDFTAGRATFTKAVTYTLSRGTLRYHAEHM